MIAGGPQNAGPVEPGSQPSMSSYHRATKLSIVVCAE